MYGSGGDATHRYEPDVPHRAADLTVRTDDTDDTDEITIRDPGRTARIAPRDNPADITVPLGATQRRPAAVRPGQAGGLPRRIPAQPGPRRADPAATLAEPDQEIAPISVRIGKGVTASSRRRAGADTGWRWQGRVTRVLAGLVTLVLVGAVAWTAYQWWQRLHNQVAVADVTVAPAPGQPTGCDIQYDIVGTVTTNGRPGTISYEWLRSDGQQSGPLKQSVAAGQRQVTVHLFWKFTGEGTMNATATLRMLSPTPVQGAAQFQYSCP